MVGRARSGGVRAFPVVETLHADSILLVTEAPAAVPEALQREAQAVAERAVACLEGARLLWLLDPPMDPLARVPSMDLLAHGCITTARMAFESDAT
jgi:hypothetical protein